MSTETNEKSPWLLKASLSEVPLADCREIYKTINLSQLPENLLQSQLCASNIIDGKILDACQGRLMKPVHKLLCQTHVIYVT